MIERKLSGGRWAVLVEDDLLVDVAQIHAGEWAIIRLTVKPNVGDLVYSAWKPEHSGGFYRVESLGPYATVDLISLQDGTPARTRTYSTRIFGVVEGFDAFFDVDEIGLNCLQPVCGG